MAKLPQEFLDRMKVQLGDEYGDFEKSMNEKGYAGLRVNTGKISVKEFLSLTPFSLRALCCPADTEDHTVLPNSLNVPAGQFLYWYP